METDCLFFDVGAEAEEMVVALNITTTINCRLCELRPEAEEIVVAWKQQPKQFVTSWVRKNIEQNNNNVLNDVLHDVTIEHEQF